MLTPTKKKKKEGNIQFLGFQSTKWKYGRGIDFEYQHRQPAADLTLSSDIKA